MKPERAEHFVFDIGPTLDAVAREAIKAAERVFGCHCPTSHFHFSEIVINPGRTTLKGDLLLTNVTLTDLQSVAGTISGVDAEGHPTSLDGVIIAAESNNTAVCSASIDGDRLAINADGSDLGTAQVLLTATFPDGSTLQDTVNVTVIASAATGLNVSFDAPTP